MLIQELIKVIKLKKIFIAGDSWGCGEWSGKPHPTPYILHSGIEEYFSNDGHSVYNRSNGGASLNEIKDQLINDYNIAKKSDIIFVFVTSTERDFFRLCNNTGVYIHEEIDDSFWCYEHYEDYIDRHNQMFRDFLVDLNELGLKINLLGGHTKIKKNHIAGLKNLKIAIPSIPEFLIPHFKHCVNFPLACDSSIISNRFFKEKKKRNIKIPSLECLEKMIENEQQFDLKKYDIMNPDGFHPNRKGHFFMYQYLKQRQLTNTNNKKLLN